MVIPGYGKTYNLQKKLNIIEAPVSKPIVKTVGVPDELKDLFGSEA
jgi:hypothetical protein